MPLYPVALILSILLFVGCGDIQKTQSMNVEIAQNACRFENGENCVQVATFRQQEREEDKKIIEAFVALDNNDTETTLKIFDELWQTTKDPNYLKESIGLLLSLNQFTPALEKTQQFLEIRPDSQEIQRTLIAILITFGDLNNATKQAKKLIQIEENEENYNLIGSLYLVSKEYQMAADSFKKAYSFQQSPLILDRLTNTQVFFLKQVNEAIAMLETHTRIRGCEENLCLRLARIYRDKGDIKQLEKTQMRLYQEQPSKENFELLIQVLLFNKNYTQAITFLEENIDFNPPLLLDLYRETKQYPKALEFARHLYNQTQDPKYIGVEAIIEYETLKPPINAKMLEGVIKKLRLALAKTAELESSGDPIKGSDLLYNFLGYLLIDHQVDIQEGVRLVQKALEYAPHSPAYLDSLGWGYYQLKNCKKALEVFESIPKEERKKEAEIEEHYQKVKQCTRRH
ncbi:hypothetical protein CCZ01_02735 [Helicobacter monodelphidis]|uniref:tetratricopeptide repeat protein n=1 Tax=Helicobacter sp. 15-1451 TaxID=2004995 RepID=UPI000DCBB6FA|nr:hypothetical protein [Helicobacter sp. 15-1451]RAX58350.1 hypothetical protein CCZ01_02735 [Helicobacter sp. 15-1451]